MKSFFLFFLYILSITTFSQGEENTLKLFPKMYMGFNGIYQTGRWGDVPVVPKNGPYTAFASGVPYGGYGFGTNLNLFITHNISLFFDGNFYSRKIDIAYKGGYASSEWVAEMTNYSSDEIGPFDEDAYFYVYTTGFRLGFRYYLNENKNIKPWFGAYYGYYNYTIGIFNKAQTQTWGNTTDNTNALSYFNLGLDLLNNDNSLGISIFFEAGGIVPNNNSYTIENCLVNGWTWHSEGGLHIIGPYRFGISINSALFIKK
jgi:hypothetical protein